MFRKVSLLMVIVLLLTSVLSSSVFAQGVPGKGQPEVMSNEASVAKSPQPRPCGHETKCLRPSRWHGQR